MKVNIKKSAYYILYDSISLNFDRARNMMQSGSALNGDLLSNIMFLCFTYCTNYFPSTQLKFNTQIRKLIILLSTPKLDSNSEMK